MTMMKSGSECHDACCCAVCTGLQTAERPLFGTGQTLTAADLTALQTYVQTKNRLHNRYQHGWGVVCGLEVLCDDCEGVVTIRPGYAIDPCGEDVVVAEPVRYDVMAAIRDCAKVARKRTSDCDPWVPPSDPGCEEALTHWCVALRYREIETAVGQRLTTGGQACQTVGKPGGSGGCGCGTGSCGCGCSAPPRSAPVADYRPGSLAASNACAPRRVRECFDVTLIPHKEPCAPQFPNLRDSNSTTDRQPLGLIGFLIPEKSLLRNIIDCVIKDVQIVVARLTDQDSAVFSALAKSPAAELAAGNLRLEEVHLALCHARVGILEILQDNHGTTRCQLLRAVADVKLAPPPAASDANGESTQNREDYIARAQQMALDLLAAWFQAILDCICRAFLPVCPEAPCDDRVELACISVKGGKILSICNHSCRKYAGAFPSTFYWMSLIPIVPLFAKLLAMLCCRPDLLRRNSPLVNDLVPLLDRVDPTGKLRKAVVSDNFALPRRYVEMAAKFADTPILTTLSKQLEDAATAPTEPEKPKEGADTAEAPQDLRDEMAALREEVTAMKLQMASVQNPAKAAPKRRRAPAKGAAAAKSTRPRKG